MGEALLTSDAAHGAVDLGLLLLRVVVGVVFSLHGFQKLFGWFGGGGVDATTRWFASLGFTGGRPATVFAALSEIGGGLGLASGFLTPLAAAAVIGTMTAAAFVNHHSKGFWSAKNGWELNLYLIAVASGLAITGPGAWSLDALLEPPVRSGAITGTVAIAVGIAAGWLRWATRRPTAPSSDG